MTIERMTAQEAEALYAAALDAQHGRIHRPGVHLEILRRAVNKLGRAECIHIDPDDQD